MNDSSNKNKQADNSISGNALFVTQDNTLASLLLNHGIEVRDFILLSFLSDLGPMSNIRLAREVGIEPKNVLKSLMRLAAAGLVLRDPCSANSEKEPLATLTGRGQDIAHRVRDQL